MMSRRVSRLRGLSINGGGNGLTGIKVVAAKRVSIEETVVPTDLNHYDKMRSATLTVGSTTCASSAVSASI